MPLFILMNLPVLLCAYLLARRIFKIQGAVDLLIAIFILYFAQIVVVEISLGMFGRLALENLISVNAIILLVILVFSRNESAPGNLREQTNFNKIIPNTNLAIFLLTILSVFGIVKLTINLINPPFGWDSLNYHFPFAVEWLKNANLNTPITIADDPSPTYYPINGSLFYLWLIFPFRSVFLADLGQLPFFVLAVLAVLAIAKKIGLSKENSFFAAALFAIIPNLFKQLSIAYVDLMVAGLFLAALFYLLLLSEDFCIRYATLYGVSLGLLLGIKTIALPYCVLLIIPFLWLCVKHVKRLYLLGIVLVCIACFGAFSYMRNFLETGNPLYPLDFSLFGKTIFKGVMDKQAYSAHFKGSDYNLAKLLFGEGLGPQTVLIILPAVFLALPITALRRRKALTFMLVYFLFLPALLYAVYRYVIPMANTRYLYPLFGVAVITGFFTLEALKPKKFVIPIVVLICALGSMAELAKKQELAISIVTTFVIFSILMVIKKYGIFKKHTKILMVTSSVMLISALLTPAFLEQNYLKNEFPGYKKMVKYSGFWPEATLAWDWLDQNTIGNNVAYTGRPVAFPLYGNNFKNNVYYVSVNKIDPALLHYFPNSRYRWGYDFADLHKNLEEPDNYRGHADYKVWLGNLSKHNTDYLFVYSLHQTKEKEFPVEDRWAGAHPEIFTMIFNNPTIHIYKIKK